MRTTILVDIINPKLKIIKVPDAKVTLNKLSSAFMVNNQSITQPTKIASERITIKIMQQQQQQQLAIFPKPSLTLDFPEFAYSRLPFTARLDFPFLTSPYFPVF